MTEKTEIQTKVDDVTTAVAAINATEKGITMMRWIRKAMEKEAKLRAEDPEVSSVGRANSQ